MRKAFLILLLAAFCRVAAVAQETGGPPVNAADDAAIRATIDRQIDAFRNDDATRAFGFADASIQSLFGTPENFMAMVRQGYAMIYRPRGYAYGPANAQDGLIAQIVEFDGLDGTSAVALYFMARQPDGSFKIAGVHLLPAKRPGV